MDSRLNIIYIGAFNFILVLIALALMYSQHKPWQQASVALAITVLFLSLMLLLQASKKTWGFGVSALVFLPAICAVGVIVFWGLVLYNGVEAKSVHYRDTEAPVIHGVMDREVAVGEVVLYRQGVTATDNVDERVRIRIDKRQVDLWTPGTYEVVYTAIDEAGNTSEARMQLTVVETIPLNPELTAMAQTVLDRIIQSGMSDKEKLFAIYNWTQTHITYIGFSDKSDWQIGALQGFRQGTGDCFNYYATARMLLELSGFEYMPVERVDSSVSDHYWLLVKYENRWYHFDPTPSVRNYPFSGFLRSQSEVEAYTEKVNHIIEGYFDYDKSDYPIVEFNPLP